MFSIPVGTTAILPLLSSMLIGKLKPDQLTPSNSTSKTNVLFGPM